MLHPQTQAPASSLSKSKLLRALQVQVCRWSIIINEYNHTHWGAHRQCRRLKKAFKSETIVTGALTGSRD